MKPGAGIGIGLYGSNGHQVGGLLADIQGAYLAAVCRAEGNTASGARVYEQYADLLADSQVSLVSICSPVRAEQAKDIRAALRAGKHVYAEKPCVMELDDLDEVIELARAQGVELFEMAGTAFEAPYAAVRLVVDSGVLGTITQLFVQKSYPYAGWRPQDERVDGGLTMQCGIHAARMIEHAAGQKIAAVSAVETGLGNPQAGELKMAASITCKLAGGGAASIIANYLNQPATGVWGNEELRIFGSDGLLQTDIHRGIVRVITGETSREIECEPQVPYLQRIVDHLNGQAPRPLPVEEETHPTRVVIRASESARSGGEFLMV